MLLEFETNIEVRLVFVVDMLRYPAAATGYSTQTKSSSPDNCYSILAQSYCYAELEHALRSER